MKSLVVLGLVLMLVVLPVPVSSQQAAEEPSAEVIEAAELMFDEAAKLADAGKYKEAYEKLRGGVELVPEWATAQFNAGLFAFLSDQFDKAAEHFEKAKELDPDDWSARAKLIQTYQALGKTEERDAERKELFKEFEGTKDQEYRERNFYVRDQFMHDGRRVFVLEYFVQKPPVRMTYKAIVTPAKEAEEDFAITMESPDFTTQFSRERGYITEEQRVYSLDGYNVGGVYHKTYALLHKELTYDEFRAKLMDILTGRMKAVSQTTAKEDEDGKKKLTIEYSVDDTKE